MRVIRKQQPKTQSVLSKLMAERRAKAALELSKAIDTSKVLVEQPFDAEKDIGTGKPWPAALKRSLENF
jgi:hypothetical protein